jgi:serine/threonine protein kinase
MASSDELSLFEGKYLPLQKLGEGAFGSVHIADQQAFGLFFRRVALKVFQTPIRDINHAREVFNDAIILARLCDACNDPVPKSYFIQVFDFGAVQGLEDKDFSGYIAMELMETDLRKVIGPANSRSPHRCTVTETLNYMRPVISALSYMHSREPVILHRDLKPENILLKRTYPLLVKVADFGLARPAYCDLIPLRAAGTLPYQDLESFTLGTAVTESDVFAVGVILYELLTGQYPYKVNYEIGTGDSFSLKLFVSQFELAVNRGVIKPSELNPEVKHDPWLEDLVLACLTPWRRNRIKNAVEVEKIFERKQVDVLLPTAQEQYQSLLEEGRVYRSKGEAYHDKAEKCFMEAEKLLPSHCNATTELAMLYREEKRFDLAMELLTKALKTKRQCCHLLREMEMTLALSGNSQLALYYRQRAAENPSCRYFYSTH